jgi:hypothetical protein
MGIADAMRNKLPALVWRGILSSASASVVIEATTRLSFPEYALLMLQHAGNVTAGRALLSLRAESAWRLATAGQTVTRSVKTASAAEVTAALLLLQPGLDELPVTVEALEGSPSATRLSLTRDSVTSALGVLSARGDRRLAENEFVELVRSGRPDLEHPPAPAAGGVEREVQAQEPTLANRRLSTRSGASTTSLPVFVDYGPQPDPSPVGRSSPMVGRASPVVGRVGIVESPT